MGFHGLAGSRFSAPRTEARNPKCGLGAEGLGFRESMLGISDAQVFPNAPTDGTAPSETPSAEANHTSSGFDRYPEGQRS